MEKRNDTAALPKMILFDYGQTLIAEERFDGVRGTAAVLRHAAENRRNLTAEQVQEEADQLNCELGRLDPAGRAQRTVEVPNYMFTNYLYESLGIRIDLEPQEIDRIFWDNASPGKTTDGMPELLEYLWRNGIRTAVVSNISYDSRVVEERINRLLPDNHFEFILATSDYLFRKPHKRIFKLALVKAGLSPEEAWYIGDNYACDIEGARNAGLYPVWYTAAVDYEQSEYDDVLRINSWSELEQVIMQVQTTGKINLASQVD